MNIPGFINHLRIRSGHALDSLRRALLYAVLALKDWRAPVIGYSSCPGTYPRRYGDFTANIVGSFSHAVTAAEYSLNGGAAKKLSWQLPRVPRPLFAIELAAEDLIPGKNVVVLSARTWTGRRESVAYEFMYDDRPIALPLEIDWIGTGLDIQDGRWETMTGPLGPSVRIIPGHELYDRILAVTGALPVDREIHAEIIFRRQAHRKKPFGFGILPLWGGRPEDRADCPRAGWNFALAWYYSNYSAVGMEFSHRIGVHPPDWVASYRNWNLEPGEACKLKIVTLRCLSDATSEPCIRQQMKWWKSSEEEPCSWMELTDVEGCRLPAGDFAVALIAHNCGAEFSKISVMQPTLQSVQDHSRLRKHHGS